VKSPRARGVASLLQERYTKQSLKKVRDFLERHGTHELKPVGHGLFAATGDLETGSVTGYQNAWVRDNVMIANSFRLRGHTDLAKGTVQGLTDYFHKHLNRFRNVIKSPALKESIQERPHIRFNARTLGENSETWPHAQNDALGYALWLRFKMANSNEARFDLDGAAWEVFSLFPAYFQAIEYWHDPDSGTWEEARKVNNSSVGPVVAGLDEMRKHILHLQAEGKKSLKVDTGSLLQTIDSLLAKGWERLESTLPFESPPNRLIDGAVLFLVHPLGVVNSRSIEDSIMHLVQARLQGPKGIKRYLGDSYFCQDYDKWFPPEEQAADFSNAFQFRDALLQPGCEAQWSLFDPVLSIIYGNRYTESRKPGDLLNQTFYFNRSLEQLTEDGKCPELYYLRDGQFVTNDHTPLAWTQANQALALHSMERSISLAQR
jgi:GH15 family glucan-1,4-alpha-glucosidase